MEHNFECLFAVTMSSLLRCPNHLCIYHCVVIKFMYIYSRYVICRYFLPVVRLVLPSMSFEGQKFLSLIKYNLPTCSLIHCTKISDMKNILDGFNGRLDVEEEKVSEIEDI